MLPCCQGIGIDGTGELVVSGGLASANYSALLAAGKTVHLDLGGGASACPHGDVPCPLWERRKELATNLSALVQQTSATGFTLDWEFGDAFNWRAFNESWGDIAAALQPRVEFEVCIDSLVEKPAWVNSSDPSADPRFRRYEWAERLTDMGTYALCRGGCTEAERRGNLTQLEGMA